MCQRDRFGDRVAPDAHATALLHDPLELSPTGRWALRDKALTRTELEALELLTHAPGEPYEVYVRRIADTPGAAGRLARIVKLADLEDHLAYPSIPSDAPPYAWARTQLLTAGDQAVQAAPGTPSQTLRPAARRNGGPSNSRRS